MNEEFLVLLLDELEPKLLPRLLGRVFHFTTPEAYARILSDGVIKSNRTGGFPFSWGQSERSYFRKRGYVCVFDLRSATREQVDDALRKCYFLKPFSNNKVVFLLLKESCYPRLIPWTVSKSDEEFRAMIIPYVEAGYPDAISLDHVERALLLYVEVPPEPEPCQECLAAILGSFGTDQKLAEDWHCNSCGAEGRPKVPVTALRKLISDDED